MDLEELKQQKLRLICQAKNYDIIGKILKKRVYIVVKLDSGGYRIYGYDRISKQISVLGSNNQRLTVICLRHYFLRKNLKVKVFADNKQVRNSFKCVFSDVMHQLRGSGYSWWCIQNYFRIFDINAKLVCNVADLYPWGKQENGRYKSIVSFFGDYYTGTYVRKDESNLKKVFRTNPKNLRFFIDHSHQIAYDNFINLIRTGHDINWIAENLKGLLNLNSRYWDIKGVVEYASKLNSSVWIYGDYLNMKRRLPPELSKSFPWVPAEVNDQLIKKKHDEILEIYNKWVTQQKIAALKELNDEYLENVLPEVKKFEYSDDNYSIIACPELKDLVYEGLELHHCVGSYTDSVGHGREYILFLRKKEELDKPFYTVNITTNKTIRQIHGLCNCNVTPEVGQFVEKWVKKFKLNASNYSGRLCHL